MIRTVSVFAFCCVLGGTSASLSAQWLKQPTAGIPRTPDGKANLTAPPPRSADGKPDLTGMWEISLGAGYVANVAADLKPSEVRPWAADLYKQRSENLGIDDPWTVQCLPLGTRHITAGGMAQILQTSNVIAILYEDLAYRQIFLDGRALPVDPNPAFMGYSVGRWDGDTLVVTSSGFNESTWLDMGGHPHSPALRMTERFRRLDFGHMEMQVTFEDPEAYTRPWTVSTVINLVPDTGLLESVCAENERDRAHLVGRTSAERTVKVVPDVLAQYVGTYDVVSYDDVVVQEFGVSLEGGSLYLEIGGQGRVPLFPLTQTTFSPRYLGTYEFVKDAKGAVTHLMAYSTEGDVKAVRRRGK